MRQFHLMQTCILFRLLAHADIPEYHHTTDHLPPIVADRCTAVFHRKRASILFPEYVVVDVTRCAVAKSEVYRTLPGRVDGAILV